MAKYILLFSCSFVLFYILFTNSIKSLKNTIKSVNLCVDKASFPYEISTLVDSMGA